LPPDTRGGGIWIGEALVDGAGKVVQVWTLRHLTFIPPFPQFDTAITDAVRQWEFEPVRVDAKPMPVCRILSVNSHSP